MPRRASANKKKQQDQPIEVTLWAAAKKLRGKVEPSEYKHVVLSLIFLKYANDRFDMQRQKILDERGEQGEFFAEMVQFYAKDNVFYIPVNARWDYIMSQAKQPDIAITIDTALSDIEKANPSLAGALPDNYYSRLNLSEGTLSGLLDDLNDIDLQKEPDKDIFGRIYEYFLRQFAIQEGKGKGEYYTPKSIVALLCELIEPYDGKVYDGACGSGGMFVQSVKFVDEHHGNKKNISIYGQESIDTTRRLAKMNLAIRGITANLGEAAESTFQKDQFPDLKVEYALMNPPFNQADWRTDKELTDDPRWKGYRTPPASNANYAWILNMVSKLSENGTGCLLLANGALSVGSEGNDEYEIRKQLIENDLVEAIIVLPMSMFYSTDISVTVWVFNKNKHARVVNKGGRDIHFRSRVGEILFMDLRQMGHPYEKKYIEFTDDDRAAITKTFHDWQTEDGIAEYHDTREYCASVKTSNLDDYNLIPSKYIELEHKTVVGNYETEMTELQEELKRLYVQEENSRNGIKIVMEALGYGI